MNWQPIETAPKDGTRIVLSDGKLFAAGYYSISIEPDTIPDMQTWDKLYKAWQDALPPKQKPDYTDLYWMEKSIAWDSEHRKTLPQHTIIKNPKAGQVSWEGWIWNNPSAFKDSDEQWPDHDGNIEHGKALWWMPMLPDPPATTST